MIGRVPSHFESITTPIKLELAAKGIHIECVVQFLYRVCRRHTKHMHSHTCTVTHTHTCTHSHTCTRTPAHTYAHTLSPCHTHTHTRIHTHAHSRTQNAHKCSFVCMCVCQCVCSGGKLDAYVIAQSSNSRNGTSLLTPERTHPTK